MTGFELHRRLMEVEMLARLGVGVTVQQCASLLGASEEHCATLPDACPWYPDPPDEDG